MVPSGTVPLFVQGFVGFPLAPLFRRIYKLGQKYRCENPDNGSGAKSRMSVIREQYREKYNGSRIQNVTDIILKRQNLIIREWYHGKRSSVQKNPEKCQPMNG